MVALGAPLDYLITLYADLILSFNYGRLCEGLDILRLYGFLASLIWMLCEVAQSALPVLAERAGNHSRGCIKQERIVLPTLQAGDLGVVFLILQVPQPD